MKDVYNPKRAGVLLGVMGASSFLPGVKIFRPLNHNKQVNNKYFYDNPIFKSSV